MTPAELRDTLGYIDANSAAIQVTGAMALLLGFVQYGEAIRLGFRDRTHAIPLVAVLFHLANDVSYSIHYFRWFHEVRHRFFTTQWFLILPFTVLELVVSPAFRTQEFYALGTVTTLAGSAYFIMLARAPRYLREGVRPLRTIRVG